jgi:hypothetical protein
VTTRSSTASPVLAALALLLLPLGAYIGGYFWLGEYSEHMPVTGGEPESIRLYRAEWQITIFVPAAAIESRLHGRRVSLSADEVTFSVDFDR